MIMAWSFALKRAGDQFARRVPQGFRHLVLRGEYARSCCSRGRVSDFLVGGLRTSGASGEPTIERAWFPEPQLAQALIQISR